MQQLEQWIKSDQMLKAYQLTKKIGALENWAFGTPLKKASLLLNRLGDRRKSDILDYLNFRNDRTDLERILPYQYRRLECVPSVTVLRDVSDLIDNRKSEMDEKLYAQYLLFKAWILSTLRDFPVAYRLIAEVKKIKPDYSWLYVEVADILEKEDRYEEALEVAEQAIACRPMYHNANLKKEVLLFHLNRDDEAIELLERMHEQTEHGIYASRLQYRYSDRDQHDKALWALDEYQRLSPLLSKKSIEWCEARKADFLYQKGEVKTAINIYAKSDHLFHKSLVTNLNRPDALSFPSKKLDVSFVRQHDMTCAPATLAALSAYYGVGKDHLEIADAICYDGTPWHKERTWAEENGFRVYEFRLTEAILMELVEKDLPFTLSTVAVTTAHLQGCIGYDARSKIVFIRDPTERHYGEMLLDDLLKNHPVTGPRGMLFIPEEMVDKVADTHFPDQHLYDCRYDLMLAMDAHDGIKIEQAMATMRAINESHPLVIQSEIRLAGYRRNLGKSHELKKQLHETFPEQQSLMYDYYSSSMSNCSREDQLSIALKAVAVKSPDPVFYAELGDLYLEDMRDLSMAEYYLKKSAIRTFSNARSLTSLAICAHRKNDLDNAVDFRRYASCKNAGYEGYANNYFQAALISGKKQEAIDYLKQRVETYGKKESASWITLSEAYETLNRDGEARQVILDALDKLPNDSDLLLHMVDRSYMWGYRDQAETYLERAKDHCTSLQWNFAAGKHAEFIGNRTRALRHFKNVLDEEPTSYAGLRRYSSLLEDEFSSDVAMDFLRDIADQHSESFKVLECYATFISEKDDARLLPILTKMIELEPNSLWSTRQLALLYERAGEVDLAIQTAEEILSKQPNNDESMGVLGGILARNGRKEEAAELFKKALSIDANYRYALNQWMGILTDREQEIEALNYFKTEVYRQSADGGSMRAYREHGFNLIEPDEMLHELHEFRLKNPFEWETWIVEKDQLLDMDRPQEAEELILEALGKFPHIPRLYIEMSSVYKHLGDNDKVIESLESALTMSPSWDWCARQLADAYEIVGDYKNTERTLKQAIEWGPLIAANHGCYADFLKRMGKKHEALDALKQALKANAGYDWGWNESSYLAKELEREQEIHELISLHDKARSTLPSWWNLKFDIYDQFDDQLALDHCEVGMKQFPEEITVHDSKAYLLAKMGKIEAAIAATKPSVYGDDIPVRLRGRRADILYDNHQQDEAFKLLEDAIVEKPNYIFALRRLVGWYTESKNYKRAKELIKIWLRHQPRSHIARGYLGDIYEKNGQLKEAAEQYQQAFQIDPEYRYAGYRGFELAIESDQLDNIPEIILLTSHYGSRSEAVEMRTRYLCKLGETEEAFENFLELLAIPTTHYEEIGKTIDLFPKRGTEALVEYVESGKAENENLLIAWQWGRSNPLKTAAKIDKLPYDPALKAGLWAAFLSWIDGEEDRSLILKIYQKYRDISKINNDLWGELGRQLCTKDHYQQAFDLLSDYEDRRGVESWMVANLAVAIGTLKGLAEAEPHIRYSLEIALPGATHNFIASMLAPIEAAQGNDECAKKLIDTEYGELDNRLIAYRKLAGLILLASPSASKLDLKTEWQIFKVHFRDWRKDKIMIHYVELAKQAVIKKGAKWPGGSVLLAKLLKR